MQYTITLHYPKCPECKMQIPHFTNNCPPYNRVREGCEINIPHVHYFCSCGFHRVTANNISIEPRTKAGSLD